MADYIVTSPAGEKYRVTAPEGASESDIMAYAQQQFAKAAPSGTEDIKKSIPGDIAHGLTDFLGAPADTHALNKSIGAYIGDKLGISPETQAKIGTGFDFAAKGGLLGGIGTLGQILPGSSKIHGALEQNVTGPMYEPQTMPGRFGQAILRTVANPLSYAGPGGAALKVGGAVASGAASEAAGEAAQGTGYETPARLIGGLAGGVAAAKTLGPRQATAAVPTAQELKAAARGGYEQAAESGLQIAPSGVHQVAENAKQQLIRQGFDPDSKVFRVLGEAQQVPSHPEQYVSSQSFDILNKRLKRIADERQLGPSGPEPTPDAAAASTALGHFREYGQNIPERDVLAGSATAYKNALGQANEDWAALKRVRSFEPRLAVAENQAAGQVAGSLDSTIKNNSRQLLNAIDKGKQTGFNQAEIDQLRLINAGGPISNTMRQAGRGGAGVIPLMSQAMFAAGSGGAFLPYQIPIAAALYGARKGSEAITVSRANKLAEMLAQRSAEYRKRVEALPPVDNAPNKAALLRALMTAR